MDAILMHSCVYGLANRIRALAGAAVVAARASVPLSCWWTANEHCPGLVEAAFDADSFFWTPLNAEGFARARAQATKPLVLDADFYCAAPPRLFARWSGLSETGTAAAIRPFLKQLRPAPVVDRILSARAASWPDPALRVGIHVRRTDLPGDDNARRDQRLYARLDRLAEEDPAAGWVVAADNLTSLKALLDRYGSHILSGTSVFDRPRELRQTDLPAAAVDLFALASCPRILGTAGSTFSTLAAEMGGSVLEQV